MPGVGLCFFFSVFFFFLQCTLWVGTRVSLLLLLFYKWVSAEQQLVRNTKGAFVIIRARFPIVHSAGKRYKTRYFLLFFLFFYPQYLVIIKYNSNSVSILNTAVVRIVFVSFWIFIQLRPSGRGMTNRFHFKPQSVMRTYCYHVTSPKLLYRTTFYSLRNYSLLNG